MMRTVRSTRKPVLLTGCALAACLAALPGSAAAQALQGTPATVAGTATITTAPGYTQVVPTSAEVVINWSPFDVAGGGTIDFLPAGATAEFAEVTGTFNYTVLNRILPVDGVGNPVSRAVAFNGTVVGRLGNFPGGSLWFYSPTGIIAGPTAVFNVGSLILTTNDIVFGSSNTGGSDLYGPGGLVRFQGPADSTGFVDVQAGAQINASASPFGPAYVALVAPRVIQAGTVQADGSIAYLAAEQLDMTINGGLFDFTLTVGTTDTQGIVHSGSTTGPASTGLVADPQRISMVALPKNDALTMLLSGSIGYTPAASVFDDGSAIVLAAGFDTGTPAALPANALGSIEIGNADFANVVTGYATAGIAVAPTGGGTAFLSDVSLFARDSIAVTAETGELVSAVRFLQLNAGEPGAGGAIALRAIDTGLIEANAFAFDASSTALSLFAGFGGLDASGGDIDLVAEGGTIRAANLFANAGAVGGNDPMQGGLATGGTIDLSALGNGLLEFAFVDVSATGDGGASDVQGGDGLGGSIGIADLGGQLDFGSIMLRAEGFGGGSPVAAGDGQGGRAVISIASQAQSWDGLTVFAGASAGPQVGVSVSTGSARGLADAISLSVSGTGSLNLAGDLRLDANSAMDTDGVAGFSGQAGGVSVTVNGGGALVVGGTLEATANATFAVEAVGENPVNSPLQQGGTVSILADGGQITAAGLVAAADAEAVSGSTTSGAARGGTAEVSAINGGSILIDDGSGGSAQISADAHGAFGAPPADAFGGTARLVVEDGSFTATGDLTLSATAGGVEHTLTPEGNGFNAAGGTAGVELRPGGLGTDLISVGKLTIHANGDARLQIDGAPELPGGQPIQGTGGKGAGGEASLSIGGGSFTAGAVSIEATGTGGTSATVALGGEGSGGTALFRLDDPAPPVGPHTIANLVIDTSGRGGLGAGGAAAESAAGDLLVETNAALGLGGDLTLTNLGTRTPAGTGIEVSVTGAALVAGGNIAIDTTRGVMVTALEAGGTLSVVGANGIAAERLASGGTTLLRADDGAVLVSTDLASTGPVTALGRSIDLTSLGSLTLAGFEATAGGATVSTVGNLTATDMTASAALNLDIGGSFSLSGLARGTAISVLSSDISLGTGALIGARGVTQTISLINRNPANTTVVGDGIAVSGYRLSAGEAASLFADQAIRIGVDLAAPGAPGVGDVAIGDLALSFSVTGNIGTGGMLEISTPARLSITGDVALTTSGADDTFLIDPSLIELDTATGSIALRNGSGTPLGRLAMVGGTVAIASGSVLDQLEGATDLAAINALLDQPGGADNALQAGTIEISVTDGLYIQNSGASDEFADRRGFIASALEIGTASGATQLAINGQILTQGGPVSGLDTIPLVNINSAAAAAGGQFDPRSTINGCVIGAACGFVPVPEPDLPGLPTNEDLDTPIDVGGPPGSFLGGPLIELAQTDPLIDPPLVDEPITGVGNDDLWQLRCDEDKNGACPETGSAP